MTFSSVLNCLRFCLLLLVFYFANFLPVISQESQTTNLFQQEKATFMMGMGYDYGFMGFRGKYKFYKSIKAVANLGVISPTIRWNIGIEANLTSEKFSTFSPYLTVIYGNNAWADLETRDGILEIRALEGPTIGLGVHIHVFKKQNFYISIGANYRIISPEAKNFVTDFNNAYGTNYGSLFFKNYFPSIGMTGRIWR